MKRADLVKGMMWGKVDMYERSALIRFYEDGVACCDGSERNRYMNVVQALKNGATDVSDMV